MEEGFYIKMKREMGIFLQNEERFYIKMKKIPSSKLRRTLHQN